MSNQYYWPEQAAALAYDMRNKNSINTDKEVQKIIQNPNFTGNWNYSDWKQLDPVNCKKTKMHIL
jgi:hypothetical protein